MLIDYSLGAAPRTVFVRFRGLKFRNCIRDICSLALPWPACRVDGSFSNGFIVTASSAIGNIRRAKNDVPGRWFAGHLLMRRQSSGSPPNGHGPGPRRRRSRARYVAACRDAARYRQEKISRYSWWRLPGTWAPGSAPSSAIERSVSRRFSRRRRSNAAVQSTSRRRDLTRYYRASAPGRSRATGGPRHWRFARQPIRARGGCRCRSPAHSG